jgi:hypothetical protein
MQKSYAPGRFSPPDFLLLPDQKETNCRNKRGILRSWSGFVLLARSVKESFAPVQAG